MRNKSTYISIILTILATIFIAIGVYNAELNIGFWGLLESFPIIYYLGLVLLSIAFLLLVFSKGNQWGLMLTQLILFIVGLWLIPSAVGMHSGLALSYKNLFDVNSIADNGIGYAINSKSHYLSWFGFHVLYAQVVRFMGFNLESVLQIYPVIMMFLYLVPLYVFLRNTIGRYHPNYIWLGLWLFSLANWIGQEYFCPQSLAILLMLTFMALLTHPRIMEGSKYFKVGMWLAISAIVVFTIATHLLTAVAMIFMLVAYALYTRRKYVLIAVAVCGLLVVGWNVTVGSDYLFTRLKQVDVEPNEITNGLIDVSRTNGYGVVNFNPVDIVSVNILSSISGSDSHKAVAVVRIIYSAIITLLGVGAGIVVLRVRRNKTDILLALMILSLLLLIPVSAAGWELGQRLYLFALPFIGYFVISALLLKPKIMTWIICIILIAGIPLYFVSEYGNQRVDYLTNYYIEGIKKVDEIKHTSSHKFMTLPEIGWLDGKPVFREYATWGIHHFAISKHDDRVYTFSYGSPDFIDNIWGWVDTAPHSESYYENELIYSNPEFSIYSAYRALDEETWELYNDEHWKKYR